MPLAKTISNLYSIFPSYFQKQKHKFNDKAHIVYDRHIRKLCEKEGYSVLGAGNQELALRFYSFEDLRTKSTTNAPRTPRSVFTKDGIRPCYNFNKDTGCFLSKTDCASDSHIRQKCKKDWYRYTGAINILPAITRTLIQRGSPTQKALLTTRQAVLYLILVPITSCYRHPMHISMLSYSSTKLKY